jgi:low temperature requirement protein LtrA
MSTSSTFVPPASQRVTTLELFFDLVFVFTITQIAHLVSTAHSGADLARAALILTIGWWMYGGYAWLTNSVGTEGLVRRLQLLTGMAAYFVMALAIPDAAGDEGLAFGVAFFVVTLMHATLFYQSSPASAKAILEIAPYNVLAATLVVVAGLVDPSWRIYLWLGAVTAFLAATFLRRERRFQVNPSHFAERHGLVVIVAIGESVVSLGAGVGHVPVAWPLIHAVVLGFALSAALWWTYFGGDDELGERALTAAPADRRVRLAILAYSYVHLGMLMGIVAIAAGLHDAIGALGAPTSPWHAWTLAGGVSLYLLSDKFFRRLLNIGRTHFRFTAAILALVVAPLGWRVGGVTEIGALLAILVCMLVAESRTIHTRHEPA